MEINILNQQEAATLREMIAASHRIVICCHKSPDGDAIGSSLGWAGYLCSLGKKPLVCVPDMIPDSISWLPGREEIVRYDKQPEIVKKAFVEADLVFCLDFNGAGRLDEMETVLTSCTAKKIMIDHHLNPELPVELLVSHPHMSSTSELVFRIVWQLGGFESMDKSWATCVYCGMMTDTGGFTYNSNDPVIYTIIGELLTKKIDKDRIYRKVFNNYSSNAIRFRGHLMDRKLHVFEDLHASYYCVTRQEMERFHFVKGDLEGLVNEPLRIKGMRFSISLREDTEVPNRVLVSLRSVDDFPCNKVAAEFFNGGGHKNASGGKLFATIEEAERIACQAIEAYSNMLH